MVARIRDLVEDSIASAEAKIKNEVKIVKLSFIKDTVARTISPIETITRVENILYSNRLLFKYGQYSNSQHKLQSLFPNFYAEGTPLTDKYVFEKALADINNWKKMKHQDLSQEETNVLTYIFEAIEE